MHTLLVLGGYGFFGARICHALAQEKNIRLLIGGRDGARAQTSALSLGLDANQGIAIDAHAVDLAQKLSALGVTTLIHTAGPFQGQDYAVARAAIEAGAHYIDLADGRDFVGGITQLDALACERGVLVTSGASSLPALSSAVVDRYLPRFSRLDSIRHGIGSGGRAPGVATMHGVFGYCGKPFRRLVDGVWQTTHGWLDLQTHVFPSPVGRRYLGSCDVPDLDLFPRRYPGVQTVAFHAGFASTPGHLAVWLGAQSVRLGLARSLTPLVMPLYRLSHWLEPLTSDKSGMYVAMSGNALDGQAMQLVWHLVAANNHGPQVPCGASIALARKLANGEALPHGAMPCMGLLNVTDYLAALAGFDVCEIPP